MPAPPLYVTAVAACADLLRQAPLPGSSSTAATALHCAVDAFPAMAAAQAAVVVLGPLRVLAARRLTRSRGTARSRRV